MERQNSDTEALNLTGSLPKNPLLPDDLGYFGRFGGCYVAEVLRPALQELQEAFLRLTKDAEFWQEYVHELRHFSGRPTPITPLNNLSKHLGGAKIFLKREDLCQTGAHKLNNVIGQGLLAKHLGKTRVIAETGAGQHGVATATMAARFGLEAVVYMGAEDVERQRPNVFWMEKLGAKVIPVEDGARTLKDAINCAMRDWSASFSNTHYLLGTACGPHPFPALVSWLQSVIGHEARLQMQVDWQCLPDQVYACVGGGSNAMGIFQGFLRDQGTKLIGVEAQGRGEKPGDHAARIVGGQGTLGIAQGYESFFLQNDDGQMLDTFSVAAGLDYVGVSPIIAHFHDIGRIEMQSATDEEVLKAMHLLMKKEGIIPALESTHAVAAAIKAAPKLPQTEKLLVNLSGRGDKDIFTIASALKDPSWDHFLAERVRQNSRLG